MAWLNSVPLALWTQCLRCQFLVVRRRGQLPPRSSLGQAKVKECPSLCIPREASLQLSALTGPVPSLTVFWGVQSAPGLRSRVPESCSTRRQEHGCWRGEIVECGRSPAEGERLLWGGRRPGAGLWEADRPSWCRVPGCPKGRTRDAAAAEAGSGSHVLVAASFFFVLACTLGTLACSLGPRISSAGSLTSSGRPLVFSVELLSPPLSPCYRASVCCPCFQL